MTDSADAPSESVASPRGSASRRTLLLLVLLCLLVRIPLLTNSLPLASDGHEYLNVAWNLAHGNGFRKTIKWNFYSDAPVVHSALGDRPILYSVALVPLVWWVPVAWLPLGLNLFSALLCTGAVAVAYMLWRELYGEGVATAAGVVMAVNPGFADIGTQPLTEPLLLLLLALAFLAARRARSLSAWGGVGVLIALAYLTRPNGVFALPFLMAVAAQAEYNRPHGATSRRNGVARAGMVLAGFILAALPFWIANARANGSPFASDLRLAYAVFDVSDATWNGFGHRFPTPFGYILGHPGVVLSEMYRQSWTMLTTCVNCLPFLFTALFFMRKRQLRGLSGALVGFGLANLAFYSLSWTVRGAVRYLLPTVFALTGPLMATGFSLPLPPLTLGRREWQAGTALVAAMLFWHTMWLGRYGIARAAVRSGASVAAMYPTGGDWLKSRNPASNAVVASNHPWMVDYLTHLPAVVCPSFQDPRLVRAFAKQYRVRFIVLFGRTNVEEREASLQAANLPGTYRLLPHNVRAWDFGDAFMR